ncbi:hypothetical protein B0J13DRAFT_665210 [Dactylonectria estremocensis]|uniref:Uncharacterized protein n=1 Tax=Dactylonectria estremocensis TaxID=1079267 RepID=A0A9P9EZ05_9HYPO|nr:hypothetical protein B0J13DRAFT_665210 [Dactylonectria estremocensis]
MERSVEGSLANRERIWQVCSQIVEEYHVEKAVRGGAGAVIPATMVDAVFTRMDLDPEPMHTTCREILLLRDFGDVDSVHPKIVVTWTEDDAIKTIDIGHSSFQFRHGMGVSYQNQTFFTERTWLTGFIIQTEGGYSTFGAQRSIVGLHCILSDLDPDDDGLFEELEGHDRWVLQARPGHFIVGLKVYENKAGMLSGLELIQQPLSKKPRSDFRISNSNGAKLSASNVVFQHPTWHERAKPLEAIGGVVRGRLVLIVQLGLSVLEKHVPHPRFLGLHLLGAMSVQEYSVGACSNYPTALGRAQPVGSTDGQGSIPFNGIPFRAGPLRGKASKKSARMYLGPPPADPASPRSAAGTHVLSADGQDGPCIKHGKP